MFDKETSEGAMRVINNTPNYTNVTETTVIVWGRPGVGFGEVVFFKDKDGKLKCDNEGMSPEFIKEVLCELVDNAEFLSVRPDAV